MESSNVRNELKIMRRYFSNGHDQRENELCKQFQKIVISKVENQRCNVLRQTANSIMRNNGDIHFAAQMYTKAIFTASSGSEELILAHLNRSLALKLLGYTHSAYEDNSCALAECHPGSARLLVDLVVLSSYIFEIENINFKVILPPHSSQQIYSEMVEQESLEVFKIVQAQCQKRRSMIATKFIKEGETIFVDNAYAFMAYKKGAEICNNCGILNIVPFPCMNCSGRVVYCSLECKYEDATVHCYECAYIIKDEESRLRLCFALRLLLRGFPEILPYLTSMHTAQDLWCECFNKDNMADLEYIQILKFLSLWDVMKIGCEDQNVSLAESLVVHLANNTDFFVCFMGTAASAMEWKIFLSAIILRHIGQLLIMPQNQIIPNLNLLSAPIEKGKLHKLFNDKCVVQYLFPKLLICTHHCRHMFEIIVEGLNMRAVAIRDIQIGEEINYCYMSTYELPNLSAYIQRYLITYFKCYCKSPDKSFKKFNQFWCKYPHCRKAFSLKSRDEVAEGIHCPHCKKPQNFSMKNEMTRMPLPKTVSDRTKLIKSFKRTSRHFKDNNIWMFHIVMSILSGCITSHYEHEPLESSELDKLQKLAVNILKFPNGTDVKPDLILTYTWDIIALRGKRIRTHDLGHSTEILEKLSMDVRVFFQKYYNDFIEPLIK